MKLQDIETDLSHYINGPDIVRTIAEWRSRADDANLRELRPLVDHVLQDRRFWLWPASRQDKHHAYIGGLALHSLEVHDGAMTLRRAAFDMWQESERGSVRPAGDAPWRKPLPRRWLFLGCLFHDYAKVIEYHCTFARTRIDSDPPDRWRLDFAKVERSERGKLHSHVTDGVMLFRDLVAESVSREFRHLHAAAFEQVVHMIHAHHGFNAWGSPVTPKTCEALILHQADMLSVFHDTGTTPMERD